jgi:hypothetical protein
MHIEENSIPADSQPIIMFMVCQAFDVAAFRPTFKPSHGFNNLSLISPIDFAKVFDRPLFPFN